MKTALFWVALLSASLAQAENKMFPTDILDDGQADVFVRAQYEKASRNLYFSNVKGRQTESFTGESASVGYGLGRGWEIRASASYVSRDDIKTKFSNGDRFIDNDGEGKSNPNFSATYGIINEKSNPFSLSASFSFSPDTTHTTRTHSAGLAAGWRKSDTLRLYTTLSMTDRADRDYMDDVRMQIGAYYEISPKITIIPYVGYSKWFGNEHASSTSDHYFGIGTHAQLLKNTYLTAFVANYSYSSLNRKDVPLHYDSTRDGVLVNVGLYHLF